MYIQSYRLTLKHSVHAQLKIIPMYSFLHGIVICLINYLRRDIKRLVYASKFSVLSVIEYMARASSDRRASSGILRDYLGAVPPGLFSCEDAQCQIS